SDHSRFLVEQETDAAVDGRSHQPEYVMRVIIRWFPHKQAVLGLQEVVEPVRPKGEGLSPVGYQGRQVHGTHYF
ncbi:hypothetical protein, partial [Shewanella algae]|uniref:hypothetical protein n=1 Tax=Shewanella algae TaxID=38313 RepID=UPI00313CAFC9